MAGNENSGRKEKSYYNEQAQLSLHDGVLEAVHYLRGVVEGGIKRGNPNRVQAAMFIVNQCIGKPTQRIEAEGSVSPELEELLKQLAEIHKGEKPGLAGAEWGEGERGITGPALENLRDIEDGPQG